MFNSQVLRGGEGSWFVEFYDLCGVNASITANFKQPTNLMSLNMGLERDVQNPALYNIFTIEISNLNSIANGKKKNRKWRALSIYYFLLKIKCIQF